MTVFFIAEAGVNHNGDPARALEMVNVAASAGADAIKFQTFSADKLVSHKADKAEYQKRETGEGNQHAMLKALEMTDELHRALFTRCAEQGIEFMSTPFDEDAADMLIDLGMRRIKVPSGEITNHPFLRHLAGKGRPLILSTGMATMAEIEEALAVISEAGRDRGFTAPLAEIVTVLHCTSNYPAEAGDVNLRAMRTIADETGMPVGYSDHTLGLAVSTAAVGLGATVIEKHFTLDRALPGPDHRASLTPDELAALIAQIRTVEAALGSPVKAPTESELPVRTVARRSVAAAADLVAGTVLGRADVALLRPGTGIAPRYMEDVCGRTLARDVTRGTPLSWDDLT
jgi:N,N'-diacetyllegionaminate synthase